MRPAYKVGLTGGIGSGKSTVSDMFSDLGVPVLDADVIAHALTAPGQPALQQITRIFGEDILDQSGQLKRKLLGNIVFSDKSLKLKLEGILHPLVFQEMDNMLENLDTAYCILSIPLLIETGATDRVDRVLVVDIPESQQLERVCKRDGISPEQAAKIINSQISRADRVRIADDIITNDGSLEQLAEKISFLHDKYLEAANKI
jgi:dephospho-CoA kinase